jgi:dihydroorotase
MLRRRSGHRRRVLLLDEPFRPSVTRLKASFLPESRIKGGFHCGESEWNKHPALVLSDRMALRPMSTPVSPSAAPIDLLLKGGHVIDPANHLDGKADVALCGQRIHSVASDIDPATAAHVIDCKGLLVTPGLLDIHLHAYYTRQDRGDGGWLGSLDPDAHFFHSGVTTGVDVGTAGADEIAHLRKSVLEKSLVRLFALVNISKPGMGDPEQIVANLIPEAAAEAALAHKDFVVGIKTAHYWTEHPFDAEHPPWASVERCVEAGRLCDMPVMIDFWPRPPLRPYPDLILEKLRPGDIHTHVFARQFPIIDENGKVQPWMREARARGIWFDVGHGAASFWYRNAQRAIEDGFGPDSISTDLHMGSIRGPVISMLDTMSKCLAMGMTLPDVIYRSTVTPAHAIRHPELGTLTPGAEADVAVLELRRGEFSFRDCGYTRLDSDQKLECAMTLRGGRIVYERDGHAVPRWQEAPAPYWEVTEKVVPIQRNWR